MTKEPSATQKMQEAVESSTEWSDGDRVTILLEPDAKIILRKLKLGDEMSKLIAERYLTGTEDWRKRAKAAVKKWESPG